jgi:TatD DNase family protein
MLYDAHNHFHDQRLNPWRDEIIASIKALGARMVVNGTSEADWPAVLEFAADWAIPSLGLHPWFVGQRSMNWKTALENNLNARKCGLGEIGLDRWMDNPDLPAQEEVFVAQLQMAAARDLPATIHCLKAWGRLREILRAEELPRRGILLHSYNGPAEMVKGFLDLGAYFSISGHFAHARKAKQRETFRAVPLDRLLVETDAPDMPPPAELNAFKLDSLNHPANIESVYRFAAELRGKKPDDFAGEMEINFRRLFGGLMD